MKKYFIVLAFIALTPSIAFAAWWNPLSWFNNWSFSGSQATPIQMTAAQYKEKFGVTPPPPASTSPVTMTTAQAQAMYGVAPTPPVQSSSDSSVRTEPGTTTDNNDYPLAVFYTYKYNIDYINGMISVLNSASTDADRYIDGITSLIDGAQTGANLADSDSDTYTAGLYNLIAQIYTEDKLNITNEQKIIDDYTATLQNYVVVLSNDQSQSVSSSTTKEEFNSLSNSLGQESNQIGSSTSSLIASYSQITGAFENDKSDVISALQMTLSNDQAELNSIQEQRVQTPVYYTPPPINFTQTNCQVYDNSASCTSY
jgi:hypothetical protein